ncbi:hypothetical protein [Dyadobacter alkalitolerans]|uniref:hypothetical protein n=1 Tax=Dyadobacter alkalitolerans TaxID=492736 RepID=UPI0003F822A3|nr:hypothetical protein [Dyadobacter alkalitolerans]
MENVKAIVKQVIKIWRLYKTQQKMLTVTMGQEIPFSLRKLLSQDYMVCSLFKKEMANFYDALKCHMRDACILDSDSKPITIDNRHGNFDLALAEIIALHQKIIAEYDVLLELAENSDLNTSPLKQHRKQMAFMIDEIEAQSNGAPAGEETMLL